MFRQSNHCTQCKRVVNKGLFFQELQYRHQLSTFFCRLVLLNRKKHYRFRSSIHRKLYILRLYHKELICKDLQYTCRKCIFLYPF